MEGAQLISIANWAKNRAHASQLRVDTVGMRTRIAALVAASLEPDLFSDVVVQDGITSLSYELDQSIKFSQTPEIFCLDFYKDFDIDQLVALAAPTKISINSYVETEDK